MLASIRCAATRRCTMTKITDPKSFEVEVRKPFYAAMYAALQQMAANKAKAKHVDEKK